MSKSFMFKLFLGLSVLAAAVMWLLTVISPEIFGAEVDMASWAILIVAGGWGVGFILNGLFSKTIGVAKKMYIMIGAGLLVVALFMIVNIFAIKNAVILPIIAIIAVAALILCLIAVGGKKWDQGDNKNVGYKNYHQRKAEQEEREAKEREKND